ncbi:MAG: PASTA domain-containing protein [Bacteroidota bacterium]
MDLFQKLKSFFWTKSFLKKIGLVILFYLVIVTITVFYLDAYTNHGEQVEVPDFRGKSVNYASSEIEKIGLLYEVGETKYDPDKPEGTVISQNPEATQLSKVYVKGGRKIRLTISTRSSLVELPNLVDRSERFAQSVLKSRGLKYKLEYRATNEADGAVLEQLYKGKKIKEGTKIQKGSTVTLIIGRNEAIAPVDIPNLVGLTIFEAKDRLSSMGNFGFVPVCPDCTSYEDSVVAIVTSQSPEYLEGTQVAGGSTFTVYASKNP